MSEGAFHAWLVETQIAPAFRAHSYLRAAFVMVAPRRWLASGPIEPTPVLIAYSTEPRVALEAMVHALATGTQDPNLPPGVRQHDLLAPITRVRGDDRREPLLVVFDPPEVFLGLEREPEGHYALLDAYAVYAAFRRGEDGAPTCVKLDAAMSARLDRLFA